MLTRTETRRTVLPFQPPIAYRIDQFLSQCRASTPLDYFHSPGLDYELQLAWLSLSPPMVEEAMGHVLTKYLCSLGSEDLGMSDSDCCSSAAGGW